MISVDLDVTDQLPNSYLEKM